MKKQILCLFLTLCMLFLAACQSSTPEVSNTSAETSANNTSKTADKTEASNSSDEASEEASTDVSGEVSEVSANEYVWYGQEEIIQWFKETEMYFVTEGEEGKPEHKLLTTDGKYITCFFGNYGDVLIDYFETCGRDYEFWNIVLPMFQANGGLVHYLEYYGISKERYIKAAEERLEEWFKSAEGERPKELTNPLAFMYDVLYSEEYWNEPLLIHPNYVEREIDSYHTPIPEGDNHTSWYYYIDYRLIEHVGLEEFEAWLDSVPDEGQNIVDFVAHFGITKDDFFVLYEEYYAVFEKDDGTTTGYWTWCPYSLDYLYGTQEMQDFYFTVHPIFAD